MHVRDSRMAIGPACRATPCRGDHNKVQCGEERGGCSALMREVRWFALCVSICHNHVTAPITIDTQAEKCCVHIVTYSGDQKSVLAI